MAITIEDDLLATLAGFSGELLRPGDADYEEARRVHNGLVDKRPALIARCHGVADVVAAVDLARDEGLDVAIRGGGHGVAGNAVGDGALMIDLTLLKGIHVDPETARARVQPGVSWAELNREAELHGLAVTGGTVSSTGIAGLTLGGGFGWLMCKHGFAADNLLSAEIVTAGGRVLTANESENEDLFWALRGGGGNFGVVTSFEYQLHPMGPITGGLVVYPFEAAEDVLRFFRDLAAEAPDELGVVGGLVHAPDGSGAKLAALVVCHVGPSEQAERDLRPVLDFGSPLDVQVGPMPYSRMNTLLDGGYPRGALNYWKSSFLQELSDTAIATLVARFAECPSPITPVVFEYLHGAATRVPATATAVPHREQGFNLLITSVWTDPEATEENIAWTRGLFSAMQPFAADRRYLNYYSGDDTGADPVRAAYGVNYERLAQVKATYDPDNMFRLNLNIEPAP